MDASEKYIIKQLQRFFKWIVVPFTFGLSLVVDLRFPAITYLIFYAKKFKPENVQRLIAFITAFMLLIAAIINFYIGVVWLGILSLIVVFFIIWLVRAKKAAWKAEPSKLVFFKSAISKSYYKNLLVNEIVMLVIVLVGFGLRYGFGLTTISIPFLFIGFGGMLLAPVWCLFIPPPYFLSMKSQAELKGKISNGEKFIGAIFGTFFPGRPKDAAERTDNALFVTNNHLFCITIPSLRFGPGIEETSPFFKTQMFRYLEEKGNQLLKQAPKEVLYSHDYNFSIPFECIRHIRMISNIFLEILGLNIVDIAAEEGDYRFVVLFPDQFEKLYALLKTVIPDKVVKAVFF